MGALTPYSSIIYLVIFPLSISPGDDSTIPQRIPAMKSQVLFLSEDVHITAPEDNLYFCISRDKNRRDRKGMKYNKFSILSICGFNHSGRLLGE